MFLGQGKNDLRSAPTPRVGVVWRIRRVVAGVGEFFAMRFPMNKRMTMTACTKISPILFQGY